MLQEKVYRLDLGGCGFFNPRGKYKPAEQFDTTSRAAVEKTFVTMSGCAAVGPCEQQLALHGSTQWHCYAIQLSE
jgi:hypothetical protein